MRRKRRRGLGIRLLLTLLILLVLLLTLVTLDIWYTTRQAEQTAPEPRSPAPGSPSNEVE